MFEVGFSELCMVGLVALLVIGPERLPKMARLAGFWLGKTRRMITSVKEEIKAELAAEEFRQLQQEAGLHEELEKLQDEAYSIGQSIQAATDQPIAPNQEAAREPE